MNVVVGMFAETEPESAESMRDDLERIRELLAARGLPDWREPEPGQGGRVGHEMWGYSGLHHLRRVAVHLAESGTLPPPLGADGRASEDPLLRAAYAREPRSGGCVEHLIHHSDCAGYYVPVEFEQVIVDEGLTGCHLGSSHRLLEVCRRVAAALDLPADLTPDSEEIFDAADEEPDETAPDGWRRHGIAALTCMQLIEAAEHSVGTGAAIVFC
ncbi:hypothetical protein DPM19_26745 [Actinomadura craniellae]|uniref:Uncharacterized protein n=1 Tax=Actinomadura craniellae TaxID=2231787 RepID=A0A365GYS7_9ACTN|nr:hypothetical protein DPM19_26745 [Actinomadura craniellae]